MYDQGHSFAGYVPRFSFRLSSAVRFPCSLPMFMTLIRISTNVSHITFSTFTAGDFIHSFTSQLLSASEPCAILQSAQSLSRNLRVSKPSPWLSIGVIRFLHSGGNLNLTRANRQRPFKLFRICHGYAITFFDWRSVSSVLDLSVYSVAKTTFTKIINSLA